MANQGILSRKGSFAVGAYEGARSSVFASKCQPRAKGGGHVPIDKYWGLEAREQRVVLTAAFMSLSPINYQFEA
mgnify:CR=1 FL=1